MTVVVFRLSSIRRSRAIFGWGSHQLASLFVSTHSGFRWGWGSRGRALFHSGRCPVRKAQHHILYPAGVFCCSVLAEADPSAASSCYREFLSHNIPESIIPFWPKVGKRYLRSILSQFRAPNTVDSLPYRGP